jgi:hypothetical protein
MTIPNPLTTLLSLEPNPAGKLLAPYVLALFDEGDGGGEGSEGSEGGSGDGGAAAATPPAPARPATQTRAAAPARAQVRSDDGTFVSAAEYERRIDELKNESISHRNKNKELKTELSTIAARQALADQRAIRAEVKSALVLAGVAEDVVDDAVDGYLKFAGDKVKVDDKTGDIVGVDGTADFKTKKPSFFKAVAAVIDDKTKTEEKPAEKPAEKPTEKPEEKPAEKPNATANGPSTAGDKGGTKTTVGGLPDLRNLSRDERKAAMADYKRVVKRGAR